ncbi:AP-4 complex subunit beta-1-like [Anneissia japonica]|uniref:AP-4 complex subunit beta-1-like n=1 Tax=Anneissia japonica TaxID=1529436 RepID=UPI001425B1B1|nr:AP-4 complex subunit beta-1-like [Anneissia japonica]
MIMTSFPPDIVSKDDIHKYNELLNDPEVTADANKLRQILQSLLVEMTSGMDISEVFMSVIKVCGSSNMVIKKLAYLYLSHYAEEKPDLALLVVNTLLKDCKHPNPMIRGLALRTFSSLRVPAFFEYSTQVCLDGLKDKSAYVKRIAVNACAKLHNQHPQFTQDNNIVDTLYGMIRDKDPITVINCLMSLEEILRMEGGVVINKKIAYYLLNRLKEFTEWGQSLIFNLLLKYKVKGEDEVIDVLNLSDSYLKHPNSGVSLAAVTMMLHLTSGLSIRDDVYKRVRGPLLNVLTSSSSHELVFAALCHIQWILAISPTLFTKHYKKFYCRYQEPEYIKFKKLDLLQSLITPYNLQDIVEEISVYCNDVSSVFATRSVKTIGSIAKKPSCTSICLNYLLSMLQLQLSHVISEVLAGFQDLLRYETNTKYVDKVMEHLPSCASFVSDIKGKTALLWLVGHYGKNLPDAPYLLEDYVEAYDQEHSSQVKVALLTATTKLFFYRPAECQSMLGKLLDSAIATEDDIEVKEKAMLYYRLLQADVQKAKNVVCASLQPIPGNLELSKLHDIPEGQFNSLSLLLDKDSLHRVKESATINQELSPAIKKKEKSPMSESTVEGTLVDIASDSEAKESFASLGADEESLVDVNSALNDNEADTAKVEGALEGITDVETRIFKNRKDAVMTPTEFEEKWNQWQTRVDEELPLLEGPSTAAILEAMSSNSIKTLATSDNASQPWKAFCFIQEESGSFYLLELNYHQQNEMIAYKIKCEDGSEEAIFSLVKVLRSCLT